jgi:hypothetical protein
MALVRVMSSLTGQARSLVDRLPDQVSQELVGVAGRLAKVRSPAQLGEVMEAELTRSLASVVPLLSRTPFPARSPGAARLMVAGVAGTAGAMQAIDELAALLGGSVAAVSAALVSLVLAWGVEVWATVAVRVRQLEEAGRQPDPARLASEVARAVMDGAGPFLPRPVAVSASRRASARFARRFRVGLVPVVGAIYEAYDAQSTIAAVVRFPVEDHPPSTKP